MTAQLPEVPRGRARAVSRARILSALVGAHLEGSRLLFLVARARWGAVEVDDAVLGLHVLPHGALHQLRPALLARDLI